MAFERGKNQNKEILKYEPKIHRALYVFDPFYENGEQIRLSHVFSFPKVFRNRGAFSFHGKYLHVAFSFSERAVLDPRYCHVQIQLPISHHPFRI